MNSKSPSILLLFVVTPLMLLATAATDRKIEDAAKASYNYRTVLDNHVTVKATDGVVTLTGTVQDRDDSALAVDTVQNLPGVTGVKNEIKIEPTYPLKSDGWMALKIRGSLLVKANVSAGATTVDVLDGVVTLGGTAENMAQKDLTEIYALEIDGVKSVQNNIVVKNADRAPATMGEKIDDASITSQVKYALFTHKSTSALTTNVVTSDGVVLITGEAATDAEKSLVTKLATDVRGVSVVSNNMKVRN